MAYKGSNNHCGGGRTHKKEDEKQTTFALFQEICNSVFDFTSNSSYLVKNKNSKADE